MTPVVPTRILLCATDPAAAGDLRRPLEEAGYEVGSQDVRAANFNAVPPCQLLLLDGGDSPEVLSFCRRLRLLLADRFVPILFVAADPSPAARLASFESGADAYLMRPFSPGELLAQVQALLRIKDLHDRLAYKTAEVHRVNKQLQAAHHLIDQELELASRLQRSFLPRTLPAVPRARFGVQYLLCGRVGGDFYDVFRLDEHHIGFYVADAMGHGVPASLLTIFVKKGVQTKEITGQSYRLVPPNEVLQRLNRDLVEQALSDQPFVTMAYVLFNHHDGTLQFARGGHPHPLYVPPAGKLQLWQVPGSLLGVFDTEFRVQTGRLRVGDKLLLYSDGIDSARFGGAAPGVESLMACAALHRELPVSDFVERVAKDLTAEMEEPDDLTLLAVEMCG
jgi:serine phosphatase RsbU (regulator of sigma subunit)